MKRWVLFVGVVLLAAWADGAAQDKPTLDDEDKFREVAIWRGDGIKNTETFSVSKREWYVIWSTAPGEYGDMNFQIYVYREPNDEMVGLAANVIGRNLDYSVMRGAGKYYLTINSGQPYTVRILEPK